LTGLEKSIIIDKKYFEKRQAALKVMEWDCRKIRMEETLWKSNL